MDAVRTVCSPCAECVLVSHHRKPLCGAGFSPAIRDMSDPQPAPSTPPPSTPPTAEHALTGAPPVATPAEEEALGAYMCRVVVVVAGIAGMFAVTYGTETGTGPCALTAQQGTFNVSVTKVTMAYAVVETSKIPASLLAGVLADWPTTLALQMAVAAVIWILGTVVIGAAPKVGAMAAGYVVGGFGIAIVNVGQAPLVDRLVPGLKKHRTPLLFSVVAAFGIVGIAVGHLACGMTIETGASAWRWNFYVAAMLILPFIVAVLLSDWVAQRAYAVLRAANNALIRGDQSWAGSNGECSVRFSKSRTGKQRTPRGALVAPASVVYICSASLS